MQRVGYDVDNRTCDCDDWCRVNELKRNLDNLTHKAEFRRTVLQRREQLEELKSEIVTLEWQVDRDNKNLRVRKSPLNKKTP